MGQANLSYRYDKMERYNKVFAGVDGDRFRLFADCGIGVNVIGDRHRRGKDFPSTFFMSGWEIHPTNGISREEICYMVLEAMRDMQEYFDIHFNSGPPKKAPKVQCVADKKNTTRRVIGAKRR